MKESHLKLREKKNVKTIWRHFSFLFGTMSETSCMASNNMQTPSRPQSLRLNKRDTDGQQTRGQRETYIAINARVCAAKILDAYMYIWASDSFTSFYIWPYSLFFFNYNWGRYLYRDMSYIYTYMYLFRLSCSVCSERRMPWTGPYVHFIF